MSQIRDVLVRNAENGEQVSDSSEDYLMNSKIQQLHQTFQKLKTFLGQLPQNKDESFQKEIIQNCGKQSVLSKSSEEILKLCEKRIQKMLRNKKTKKNWNQDDIEILVWILNKYTTFYAKKSAYSFEQADWKFVSSLIPATSWKKCMFKWLSLKKFSLLTFRWSNEESDLLASLINQNRKRDWKKIAQKLYVCNNSHEKVFRTSKQCRQHWNCYLNPTIKKGPWSMKEDIKLLESVLQLNCMKRWSEVVKNIKGRTQNAVKNRFTLLLQKQKKLTGEQNEKHLINHVLVKLIHEHSSNRRQMKSEEIQQLHAPSQIFEESQGYRVMQNRVMKVDSIVQGKTQQVPSSENIQENKKRKVIIPTFTQIQPTFHRPWFLQISPEFNPCFFNFMYGGPFQLN